MCLESGIHACKQYHPLKSGTHVPSLGEAGQREPDAGSDVGSGEDVDGELQGPHVGHGNVQRTLQAVKEDYQLQWNVGPR